LEGIVRKKALLVTCVVAAAMVLPVSTASALDDVNTQRLRNAVTVNNILNHERALDRIADRNGGTRASGTPGFRESADYVEKALRSAGYRVTEQQFDFAFFQELAAPTLDQVSPTPKSYETATFQYSGSGDVQGALVPTNDVQIPPGPTPSSSNSGCEAADFDPPTSDHDVALIQRGTCTFGQKAANAKAAGYAAAIIFNEGQPGRTDLLTGTLGAPEDIPVVGLSFADGQELYAATQAGTTIVHVTTNTVSEIRPTWNILADSRTGNPDKAIVVGAHLDSVVEGPGINDNGSGTAVNLETAIQIARLGLQPRQQLRFAFWGAEEEGLLGSTHYVASLSDDDLAKIYANLNFDMLASPNYVRFVYDGDGSGTGPSGPPGSAQIEQLFDKYFADQGLASEPTAFDGRSDYGPFIAAGIPAGGLFSGAEGIKTAEEAVTYGGTAGEAYDSCYHQACDDITNLSTKALFELGDAVAHATWTLARSRSGLFEDGSRMAMSQAVTMDQFDYRGGHLVR